MESRNINRVISLIFNFQRLAHERYGRKINAFNFIRFKTLIFVDRHPDSSMRHIAEYLGVTPPSATSLVNNMVREGYLKRVLDEKDRRIVRLAITPKGKKNLKNAFKNMAGRIKKALSALNKTEIDNLAKIMEKLSRAYAEKENR